MDFVLLTSILYACPPNTRFIASVSNLSLNGVEVPCALT